MTPIMVVSKFLVFILLAKLAAASDNDFIFNGFTGANLSLNGLAEITSGGLVKLTNDTKPVLGHAFYPSPLHFNNSDNGTPLSFSTTFVCAIVPEDPDVSGHGIAFAIAPSKGLPGSQPSQHLGLFNETNNGNAANRVVAIELDTVQNAEFADINDNHVGIDVNGLHSVNSSPVAYFDRSTGKSKSLQLISGQPMQVWVDYSGKDMKLDVRISPIKLAKPDLPLVSSKVNLSKIVLDDMYVGFSASTGAASGSHYVLGWSFSLNGDAQALDLSKLPAVPYRRSPKKRSQVFAVALPLTAVILLLLSIAGLILIVQQRKKFAEVLEDWELEYGPHRFSYRALFRATRGFKEEQLLGVGGFGRVYKGVLPASRTEIAVKKVSHESRQGMREFIAEIVSMGRLRHRNLVQLLGYCRRQGELLLVYDFMPNGSLDKFLFFQEDDDKPTIGWSQRFQIIKGVASGLLYLHEGWEQVVIHRDIKASNVLLDGELNGKLGDFGLARLYDHGTNPQTTHIVGTLGYLAPELSKTGKATTKTDIYAFGSFLLEVACGRRPVEIHASVEEPGLVDWVLECWKRGAIVEASDPKMGGDYIVKEVELVLKLGLLCSHPEPMARPGMKQVMQILEGELPLPSLSPDNLSATLSAKRYDESFDDFVMSYPSIPSTSANTFVASTASFFSGTR